MNSSAAPRVVCVAVCARVRARSHASAVPHVGTSNSILLSHYGSHINVNVLLTYFILFFFFSISTKQVYSYNGYRRWLYLYDAFVDRFVLTLVLSSPGLWLTTFVFDAKFTNFVFSRLVDNNTQSPACTSIAPAIYGSELSHCWV